MWVKHAIDKLYFFILWSMFVWKYVASKNNVTGTLTCTYLKKKNERTYPFQIIVFEN